jgi:hypothetical protein
MFIPSEAFRSLCCVEIGGTCPSMFSEVLDTLLAVAFPSHGDHSTLFPYAFSCFFVGVSHLSMSEG